MTSNTRTAASHALRLRVSERPRPRTFAARVLFDAASIVISSARPPRAVKQLRFGGNVAAAPIQNCLLKIAVHPRCQAPKDGSQFLPVAASCHRLRHARQFGSEAAAWRAERKATALPIAAKAIE